MSESRVKEGDLVHYNSGQGTECELATVTHVNDDENGWQYVRLKPAHSDTEVRAQFDPYGRITAGRGCHLPRSCQWRASQSDAPEVDQRDLDLHGDAAIKLVQDLRPGESIRWADAVNTAASMADVEDPD